LLGIHVYAVYNLATDVYTVYIVMAEGGAASYETLNERAAVWQTSAS
jgi:hypothetical protein